MSMGKKRPTYDKEFKRSAINLCQEEGKTVPIVAKALGIHPSSLYHWLKEDRNKGELAFPGHGNEALSPEQKHIRELEEKLKDVELERDILKKAVGIFSKTPNGNIPL